MCRFILTKELGRLSKWLRILGFDTIYYTSDNIGELIVQALCDKRIIITKRKHVGDLKVIAVHKNDVKEQLKEVIEKLHLTINQSMMFRRCIVCNALLEELTKEDCKGKIPDYVYNTQQEFYRCPACERIYWQGTHWGNVRRYLDEIKVVFSN